MCVLGDTRWLGVRTIWSFSPNERRQFLNVGKFLNAKWPIDLPLIADAVIRLFGVGQRSLQRLKAARSLPPDINGDTPGVRH